MIVEGEGLFLTFVSCSAPTKISECIVFTGESSPSTATECFRYSTILEHCMMCGVKIQYRMKKKDI